MTCEPHQPCTPDYRYEVDDLVRVNAMYRDPTTGDLIDPSTVVLEVTSPGGVETTPPVYNESLGVYYALVEATEAGRWYFRWVSTGAAQGAESGYFWVRETGPADCGSAEADAWKAHVQTQLASPRRVRGDQGEVEARSVDETIKADQYLQKRKYNRHDLLADSIVGNTRYKDCR